MSGKRICIDAGHYGKYNRSPAVKEYYESDMTWKLHLMLAEYLKQHGFEVVTTRADKDKDLALYERGAASKGCVLFLSLHSNAAGSFVKESVDRVDIYAPISGKGHDIAQKLADCIASVMETKQPGYVKTRANGSGGEYYGVLRGAAAVGTVGLLVEHSFHTNTRATKWLLEESNLDRLAKAEAAVIAEYFGMNGNVDASGMTDIAGKAKATAQQMQAYIKAVNPAVARSVLDMIPLYLSEGEAEGIRGDVAFAQSCLETGNFAFNGSAVTLDQNNFCGMGVTSNGMRGNSFDTPQQGIRAQIQHLKAYANGEPLVNACIDPRFKYVTRGSACYVEWLGIRENPDGKGWASGAGYGKKILGILAGITATDGGAPDKTIPSNPYKEPSKNIKKGFKGDGVRWVQWELLQHDPNCLPKYGTDGDFGNETLKAVKAFQRAHNLETDGIVGKLTRAALKNA